MASRSPFNVGKCADECMEEAAASARPITHTPINERTKPTIAVEEGLSLKTKLEMKTEKSGAVLTRAVAFNTVVSLTAETKKMKCIPSKRLRMKSSLRFFFTRLALKDF
jgi:hypothetical protein